MKIPIAALSATLAMLLVGSPSVASDDVSAAPPLEPQVQNGVAFLTGGVGDREQEALREVDDEYNVRVALTRDDGAYLSQIRIAIEDAGGTSLVETTTRGPILLAKLEPGRYVLEASTDGRTTERRVIDVPTQRDPVRLYVALAGAGTAAAE